MTVKLTKTQTFLLLIGIVFLSVVGWMYQQTVAAGQKADVVIFTERTAREEVTPEPMPPVNVNTADLELLQTLDGIGPALAQRVIDYRQEHGPFASLEELLDVKGIGPHTLEKFRERATTE